MASRKKATATTEITAKPLTAADLVAAHQARFTSKLPPPEALEQLDEVMRINQSTTNRLERLQAGAAIKMLASYGWHCEHSKFQKLIRSRYQRNWGD